MTVEKLTIYDFVVDLTSGVVAIILAWTLLPAGMIEGFELAEVTLGSGLLVVVVGYFVGHLVQGVASPIDTWVYFLRRDEYPFEARFKEVEEGTVEAFYLEEVDSFFGGGVNGFSALELFKLTQSYLWTHGFSLAQRFQILYTFFRSMWVLLAAGAVVHSIALAGAVWWGYPLYWSVEQSVVFILVLIGGCLVSYRRRLKFHFRMVDAMIFDFCADVVGGR